MELKGQVIGIIYQKLGDTEKSLQYYQCANAINPNEDLAGKINEVEDIHHIHIWSMDGYHNYATMHIVSKSNKIEEIKKEIRKELLEHNICHAILETEEEACDDIECHIEVNNDRHHHHH